MFRGQLNFLSSIVCFNTEVLRFFFAQEVEGEGFHSN